MGSWIIISLFEVIYYNGLLEMPIVDRMSLRWLFRPLSFHRLNVNESLFGVIVCIHTSILYIIYYRYVVMVSLITYSILVRKQFQFIKWTTHYLACLSVRLMDTILQHYRHFVELVKLLILYYVLSFQINWTHKSLRDFNDNTVHINKKVKQYV